MVSFLKPANRTTGTVHIGFICDEYPPAPHGGNGSLYSDLAEGLAAAGHRVTVVGIYSNNVLSGLNCQNLPNANPRVIRLKQSPDFLRYRPRAWWERYRLFQWLKREHKNTPFDVIEAPDYGGWLCFGGPKNVATVIRMGGSNLFFDTELGRKGDPFEHRLELLSVAKATHLGAVSGYCARRTLEFCRLPERSCHIVYNAVDTALFAPASEATIEPGLVVFVNSLNPKKGVGELVEAMNIVCREHPSARLAVIGQDTQKKEGGLSYVEQLQQKVRPEFRDRVLFTGRLGRHQGVLDYLRRAQVCCYPSHMETFGIAPIEAMAMGKATIYSRTGPGPEVIEDNVSGLLCNPKDPNDIAAKILLLLKDDSLNHRLGANARKRVMAMFDKSKWIQKNIEFFQQCLSPGNGTPA